jgi:conserved oligomeric Golgi complex subunit 1
MAGSGSRGIAAQILLLQKCRSCITRLLRDHESSLLAAKVLSVSRLLLKTLSQATSPPPVLDALRIQLASLRRHLLRRLDQRLSNLDTPHERLVEALCAFCLATSSSSNDALRHYHRLRLQEIRRVLQLEEREHHNVIEALRYYTKSLQTTKALLGRSLSEVLRNLGTQPILRDHVVQSLDELDLSTLQRWVAVEIQDFVPFIKHSDLAGSGTHSPTIGWSREAFDSFGQALKKSIEDIKSTTGLLNLRRALLETWLPVCVSTPVHSSSEILYNLRDMLNKRMNHLIRIEAATLTDIGSTIASVMSEDSGMIRANSSIWDETFVATPTGKGASTLKQQLRMRHLGIMESVSQILRSLDSWIAKVGATKAVIDQLRKDRWQDHVEEDEDDEESAAKIESVLQGDDPKLYRAAQASDVAQAFSDFQLKISDTTNVIRQGPDCDQVQSLLRFIREASQRLRQAFPEADLTILDTIAPSLHSRLASDVATKLLAFSKLKSASQRLSYMASSHLWEGVPPLPMQPSARIFRLLCKLNEAMAELGGDLWTHAAVCALKKAVSERLVEHDFFDLNAGNLHGRDRNGLTNGTVIVNGDTAKPPSSIESPRIQDFFDVFYLNYALAPKQGDDVEDFAVIVEKLSTLSELEDSDVKAVRRRAKDYWARTNLLFGLLA